MNNNETQLLNSVLAIAALSANISPEELKEYVNCKISCCSLLRFCLSYWQSTAL